MYIQIIVLNTKPIILNTKIHQFQYKSLYLALLADQLARPHALQDHMCAALSSHPVKPQAYKEILIVEELCIINQQISIGNQYS